MIFFLYYAGTDLQLSHSEETLIYEKEQIEPDVETSYLYEGILSCVF